jgi:hypothetical protein
MEKKILIQDADDYNLIVSLDMLLNDLELIGNKYVWSILYLEAFGDLGISKSYDDIDRAIESPYGYCLCWDELRNLAKKFDQVINLILIAAETKKDVSLYKDKEKLCNYYPIVIEILDGDYWEVYAMDENIIKTFQAQYKQTKIEEI